MYSLQSDLRSINNGFSRERRENRLAPRGSSALNVRQIGMKHRRSRANCALGLPRLSSATGRSFTAAPLQVPSLFYKKTATLSDCCLVRETGLESRANCALGLPRLYSATGRSFTPAPLQVPSLFYEKTATLSDCCLVRETGLEPVWKIHTPLKRARLPVPPLSRGRL